MPVYGRLDAESVKNVPAIAALAADPVEIEQVETLTFTFEVGADGAFDALPKALHPPGPPYCSMTLRAHGDSPVGAFTLCELKLHTRAAGLFMGYALGAFASSKKAAAWLRDAYGAPVQVAETVALVKRHYGYEGLVVAKGKTVFEAVQRLPGYISGSDVLYVPNLNLAAYEGERALIAEEFGYQTKEARRGEASYRVRDLAAFGAAGLTVTNELPSTYTKGSWTYESVRYTLDPKTPAVQGMRRVDKKKADA